ncbi:hypothetical protein KP509_21G004700 [Ceratopteris richardii]|uniref:Uncharacterized protein n=1 Tax=Ceratopteris richardii TaxID=49495 RepID=A0A8T2S755_CERRI|nr:hypothetical protein KP509_21G004700 [Ceratopteris richardii]
MTLTLACSGQIHALLVKTDLCLFQPNVFSFLSTLAHWSGQAPPPSPWFCFTPKGMCSCWAWLYDAILTAAYSPLLHINFDRIFPY